MTEVIRQTLAASGHGEMPDHVFAAIAGLAHREAGLLIPASKRALVQSRISRRLRALGLSDYAQYCDLVQSEAGRGERRNMVSALTTNVSSFFREKHHFQTLAAVAPALVARARSGGAVRLWSAGCSTGQEPYSIAMTLLEADASAARLDIRILATDIDAAVLETARRGVYEETQLQTVAEPLRRRHFAAAGDGVIEVSDALRGMIRFRELNLLGSWPMKGRFDAIFCRNVVIYFDEATQAALWPRFGAKLADDGLFFVGHSERVADPLSIGLRPAGITSYRASPAAARYSGQGGAARARTTDHGGTQCR